MITCMKAFSFPPFIQSQFPPMLTQFPGQQQQTPLCNATRWFTIQVYPFIHSLTHLGTILHNLYREGPRTLNVHLKEWKKSFGPLREIHKLCWKCWGEIRLWRPVNNHFTIPFNWAMILFVETCFYFTKL